VDGQRVLRPRVSVTKNVRDTCAVVGDGGLAVGLFQFHPDTWREESRFLGYTEDLRADPVAASRVAAFMFSKGMHSRWTWYGIVARRYP
jgi:hypothetical protein